MKPLDYDNTRQLLVDDTKELLFFLERMADSLPKPLTYATKEDYLRDVHDTIAAYSHPNSSMICSQIRYYLKRDFRWRFDAFQTYDISYQDIS